VIRNGDSHPAYVVDSTDQSGHMGWLPFSKGAPALGLTEWEIFSPFWIAIEPELSRPLPTSP
jgi:hypothetical protein